MMAFIMELPELESWLASPSKSRFFVFVDHDGLLRIEQNRKPNTFTTISKTRLVLTRCRVCLLQLLLQVLTQNLQAISIRPHRVQLRHQILLLLNVVEHLAIHPCAFFLVRRVLILQLLNFCIDFPDFNANVVKCTV
jgi:hypothetical protein